jgi:hypothetical protein
MRHEKGKGALQEGGEVGWCCVRGNIPRHRRACVTVICGVVPATAGKTKQHESEPSAWAPFQEVAEGTKLDDANG